MNIYTGTAARAGAESQPLPALPNEKPHDDDLFSAQDGLPLTVVAYLASPSPKPDVSKVQMIALGVARRVSKVRRSACNTRQQQRARPERPWAQNRGQNAASPTCEMVTKVCTAVRKLFRSVGGTYAPSQDPLSSSAAAPYPQSCPRGSSATITAIRAIRVRRPAEGAAAQMQHASI